MDQVYQAKLSGSPPGQHPPNQQVDDNGDIHIQPMPNPHPYPTSATANEAARGQPIPVQLPNIYVTAPSPASVPAPAPAPRREHRPHTNEVRMMHIGPFRFTRPHPLLWITLGLSLIALVLEVPKGSLPTLTGRHKRLRTQEKLVQERLHLLTRLSTFLPPPLAHIIDPQTPAARHAQGPIPNNLDLLKFWNSNANSYLHPLNGIGQGGDRWWSIEELGEGASVVRSKSHAQGAGVDREVWVLRVGSEDHDGNQQPLLNALTHSLLLRDQQQAELASLKAHQSSLSLSPQPQAPAQISHKSTRNTRDDERDEELEHRNQERARRKKEREREKHLELEEREQEVGRRERWVIEEMRKLTDKVHAEASELTLEDRITERLKSYQRQLSKLAEEGGKDQSAS